MKRKVKDKVTRKRKPKARPQRVRPTPEPTPEPEPAAASDVVAQGGGSPCTYYPPCSRENCGAPACSHEVEAPHPCPPAGCEAYLFPPGMDASTFQGGGGGFGGGGATGGW